MLTEQDKTDLAQIFATTLEKHLAPFAQAAEARFTRLDSSVELLGRYVRHARAELEDRIDALEDRLRAVKERIETKQ